MTNFVEIDKVSKKYADHLALDQVSITVAQQSIFGLLGPNGAGKTSLIRILNQITAPDSGEIFINGEKLCQKHIEQIGYLPEERGLYRKMKVGEQAIYLAQLKGIDSITAKKRLKTWFEKFEILNWWDKKVEELSKGMQQKIQFIVTIIHEPELLIFDEPFSGFDPINVNLLKEEILHLRDKGCTIIFSTHNMASVEELCSDIALINNGKLILDGKIMDIKNKFKKHIFEIVMDSNFSGKIPSPYQILEKEHRKDGNIKIVVKSENQENSNILIRELLDEGQIISFQEILPSVNDIFIQQVQK